MKTIIAPTNFSAISINAVQYAADLAQVIGADLSLIHVFQMPLTFTEVPVPANTIEELVAGTKEQMKYLKENIMYSTCGKIKIRTEVIQGDVVPEIAKYCASVNPYAVVIGTESGGAFERFLIGGKTISAIRKLSWPLIAVPPEAKFSKLRKIGLACDFRKVVGTIPAKEIRSLVKMFSAELHVLHVTTKSGDSFDAETITESQWLQDILGELNPKYHFIKGADIEKNINEFVEKNKLDLLIIIPKKHRLINKLIHHSHSKQMVLHAHVPVMSVHE